MRTAFGTTRAGFTLIELLVVVVIIGILASVALPSFVGAQDKARNSAVSSNIKTVKLALEQYATDNQGTYPAPPSWTVALSGGGAGNGNGNGNGNGKGGRKKKGCGDDCMDGLEDYLAGGTLPRSPWANEAGTIFARVPAALTNAKEIVEDSLPLSPEGTVIAESGRVPAAAPTTAGEYGAIAYSYNPASTAYTLYGTGKKGKQAILASGESNRGK